MPSWLLALAMSIAVVIPASAAETAPLPQLEDSKSYFLTNYDVNKPFSLTFSQVIDSREPQMGNIEITLLKGGVLRCEGDYAYVALAADEGWKLYDGPQDVAYFADRGIRITPTVRMENTDTDSSKYTQGYTWQFDRPGTSETTFSPDAICTRAQIVTFLYRFLG